MDELLKDKITHIIDEHCRVKYQFYDKYKRTHELLLDLLLHLQNDLPSRQPSYDDKSDIESELLDHDNNVDTSENISLDIEEAS